MKKTTAEEILTLLPQTQCKKCGHECCRDYAEAIAKGAQLNCCPTGGEKGIRRLSRLTGRKSAPLDPKHGEERPRDMAIIDESACTGCRLCVGACPVDAIIGATGFAHTVLLPKCTGCGLCLPVCPVDCIIMKNASGNKTGWDAWSVAQAKRARETYEFRKKRLEREEAKEKKRLESLSKTGASGRGKKETVMAAIEKARARQPKQNNMKSGTDWS